MRKYIYFIALICCALSASTSYAQKKVIKTMMIAGQDGSHYWRGACEAMKQILENSGMFKVDFVFTPDFGGDINTFKPDFAKYNLVVVNYGGEVWPEPVQKAFENYVADGGLGGAERERRPLPVLERGQICIRLYTRSCGLSWLAA